jgi:hypothetical protein
LSNPVSSDLITEWENEMAKATKVPADYEVTLTLSRAEAESLKALTGNMSAAPEGINGPLPVIYNALNAAGVSDIRARIATFSGNPRLVSDE